MKVPAISIRVRTYLRTGSGERLLSDRVLKPLTAAQRRQGQCDELRDYLEVHGLPGSRRKGSAGTSQAHATRTPKRCRS